MTRDPVYRNLRCQVQALLDRDAPHACVLIEVDWEASPAVREEGKVVCIARDDLSGRYNVWTVGFIGTEPSNLNNGRYDIALTTASAEMDQRLWR